MIDTKEIGPVEKIRAMVYILMLAVLNILDNGKTTNKKVREPRYGLTAPPIQATFPMESNED